jgi:hypothetical protein
MYWSNNFRVCIFNDTTTSIARLATASDSPTCTPLHPVRFDRARDHDVAQYPDGNFATPWLDQRHSTPTGHHGTSAHTKTPLHLPNLSFLTTTKMSHESVYYSRPRTYGKGSRNWSATPIDSWHELTGPAL